MSNLAINSQPFSVLGPSSKAWLDAFDPSSSLHSFLPVGPLSSIPSSENRLMDWRDAPERRKELALTLSSQDLPYSEAQTHAIQDILNPTSVMVVTGQQPGALGGPLYTYNKILSVIVFSQRLREKWKIPVIPVLWDGGDDHDLTEVDEVTWPKGEEGIARFHFGIGEEKAHPAWSIPLTGTMRTTWEGFLEEVHPPTDFRQIFSEWFSPLWTASHSWCDLFDRFWLSLFKNHPLLIIRPWESAFRKMAAHILAHEIENPEASMETVAETTAQLFQAGYKIQVHKKRGVCNFFYLAGEKRNSVTFSRDHFRIEGQDNPVSKSQLLDECQTHPERFSPNALLRPVIQDAILPSVVTVSGPSEIAYQAQLKGLYQHHGICHPWIVPRLSMTFTTPGQITRMKDMGLSWGDLKRDETDLIKHLAASRNEDPALVSLCNLEDHLERTHDELSGLLHSGRHHLMEPVESQLRRAGKILDQVKDLLLRDEARRDSAHRARIRALKNNLLPGGHLQERLYGLPLLLCRHGFDWIESLIENAYSWNGESHYIITVGK